MSFGPGILASAIAASMSPATATRIVETSISDKIEGACALIEEHGSESRPAFNAVLRLDTAHYCRLESAGTLFCLLVYAGGNIVGYSVNTVSESLHYQGLTYCDNDALFISRQYRTDKLEQNLIERTELAAKKRGADLMFWHAKEESALSETLARMGCKVHEIVFSKEIV